MTKRDEREQIEKTVTRKQESHQTDPTRKRDGREK